MSEAERDHRLEALRKATETWATRRTRELENSVAVAKKVLKGRTGSERLAAATTQAASDLVVNEINAFLLAP